MSITLPIPKILVDAAARVRRLFAPRHEKIWAEALFARVMVQCRQPGFYLDGGVADTIDGRFDLMALHVAAFVHGLRQQGEAGILAARALEEAMFANLDIGMREEGISDMGVPRRMKTLTQAWFGRLQAYLKAIAAGTSEACRDVVARNLFRGADASAAGVSVMAAYLADLSSRLAAIGPAILDFEAVAFPPAPGAHA